jgi:pyridoxal phosphate enzyme (YggS family)
VTEESHPSKGFGNDGLADRLGTVRAAVTDAARSAGRDPAELTMIVVTKFHPASLVRDLVSLGVTDVGENRHQEAAAKSLELSDLDLRWHFVGQLQSKKARAVRSYASVVHSVDRDALVDALATREGDDVEELDCFVQINLTEDPARGGVRPEHVMRLVERVMAAPGLQLLGVMAVAPIGEEPRRAFERLRGISTEIQSLAPQATKISAGMSGDFRDAIAEGATHLRIGTAITGIRPDRG